MLSHPSVGRDPESCLRFWRSFVYLRISPLHTKFHSPLSHSSELVSRAFRHFLATFTFNPIHRLRALYAQSFRRTLAPPLLRTRQKRKIKREIVNQDLDYPLSGYICPYERLCRSLYVLATRVSAKKKKVWIFKP
uniref:hypothetical protein n=1 Tax=Bidens parviflora TaxID=1527830 RepID=UPI001FF1FD90|nr:hypothetical protein MFQ53_mgp23 [Bidens parviflora]UIR98955.1 hypothetical protein [Bidens parviflora]